jgi:hypothetical protein
MKVSEQPMQLTERNRSQIRRSPTLRPVKGGDREPLRTPSRLCREHATRRRRNRQDNSETSGEERFFLASGSSDGAVPALGRECGSEAEAIIDAFRERVNFYRFLSFRPERMWVRRGNRSYGRMD